MQCHSSILSGPMSPSHRVSWRDAPTGYDRLSPRIWSRPADLGRANLTQLPKEEARSTRPSNLSRPRYKAVTCSRSLRYHSVGRHLGGHASRRKPTSIIWPPRQGCGLSYDTDDNSQGNSALRTVITTVDCSTAAAAERQTEKKPTYAAVLLSWRSLERLCHDAIQFDWQTHSRGIKSEEKTVQSCGPI